MRKVPITFDERRALLRALKPGMACTPDPSKGDALWIVDIPQLLFVVTDNLDEV